MATENEAAPQSGVKPAAVIESTSQVPGAKPEGEDVSERVKALNAENAQRRIENKELKDRLSKLEPLIDAFQSAFGVKEEAPEKVKEAAASHESELRNILLESAFEVAAAKAGANDPRDLIAILQRDLADVPVDVKARKVDADAMAAKVAAAKKAKPYLFASEAQPQPAATPSPGPSKPSLGGSGNELERWRRLKESGDQKSADEFYRQNKQTIGRLVSGG